MAPLNNSASQLASVAIFCPQSKAPQESYLNNLHSFISRKEYLAPFREAILDLKNVWTIFANQRDDIAALAQGPRYMQALSDWITTGNASLVSNHMSGIISLPLLVIIQIGQYFQYLELHGIKHAELLARLRKGGGVQGYCGGLPPAIAVASAKDEAELVQSAAIAMRLALAIGAYGELGDDESIPGATTIVVRTKRAGQGDELINMFPGAYISAVTDPKTVSIVGPVPVLSKIQDYARGQGLLVQEMHIRGKVHNPENADLAKELCELCDRTPSLQLPSARTLQAPVRSNRNGQLLTDGSLTHEVVSVILASRCEWYTLLTELARDLDLSGRRSHLFATFGIGDCIPLSPFHKLQLQITKLDVISFIDQNLPSTRDGQSPESQYAFPSDAVAIIGASCRLPGANSLEELWDLISSGKSRHTELPTDRFDLHSSFRASQDWKFAGKRKFYGNFIDDVGNYDHAFFRTNPKEALNMDPQQRILLELAYQAMESSGYMRTHKRDSGDPVGCFIGASFVEYLDNTNSNPATAYTSTGTIRAFLSGRISYYFGWSGPSEILDTACSSSLVAINRACKAIQTGECTMALTGGINIMTGINNFLDLAKAGFLSPTGQCKPFDQAADGYCRSEGGGLVVLKSLSQSLIDGDQILGVIPGVSTNQGGLSASITIPHSPAQKKLYQTVLRQADMKPEQVSYVETHGTGTQAGDPLEIASVREVFGGPNRSNFVNVGSLKGNIGHCETGAGVASLLKVLAMINKGGIPPQASHQKLNPKIPELEPDKMCISSKAGRWEAPLLAACVNSYGAAGSNCALICCEGPPTDGRISASPIAVDGGMVYPITISAASRESLFAYARSLEQYLENALPRPILGDVAFTLSERRKHDRYFFTTTASEITGLTEALKSMQNDPNASLEVPSKSNKVVLAFGGQSKKAVGMDEGLYLSVPQLRTHVDICNDIVTRLGHSPLLPAIFQSEPVQDVVTLQCGTFAMQYACAMCWIDAGLEVHAVVGHSFGELTAMVVSGVLSLHDGLKLIASRAALMKTKWGSERGTMLAVFASRDIVKTMISAESEIEIACYNSPSSQVLVGSSTSIAKLENLLKEDGRFQGIRFQQLDVTHGFHSKFTTPILGDLDEASKNLAFRKPEIPLETCTELPLGEISPDRASIHARQPVYFSDAVQRIEQRLGPAIWIEAGMNCPIIPMVKSAVASPNNHSFLAMKMQNAQAPTSVLADMTINLWQQGRTVSPWHLISRKERSFKQVWLPPYQFQPTSHWLANVDRVIEAQQKIPESVQEHKQETKEVTEPSRLVTRDTKTPGQFQIHLATQRFTKIVSGHAVRQRPLCPAAMYMECAAMAIQMLQGEIQADSLYFEDLVFLSSLGVDLGRDVFLVLEETGHSRFWSFTVKSTQRADPKSRFVTHAKGKIGLTATQPRFQTYQRLISESINEVERNISTEKLMSKRAYGLFALVVHYADFLQGISNVWLSQRQAVAEVDIPLAELGKDETSVTQSCDTIALDVFIQVVGLLINSSDLVTEEEVYVATGVECTSMSSKCNLDTCKSWTVYTKFETLSEDQAAGDIFVLTRDRTLVMTITGVQFTKLLISKLEKFLDSANPKAATDPAKAKVIPEMSPVSNSIERCDSLPNLSSSTSVESDSGPRTPELVHDAGAESLRNVIAEYTGISGLDIASDANIADLGVDSLAAVELAEELQSRFGKEIAAEDLLAFSYEELAKICQVSASIKTVAIPTAEQLTLATKSSNNQATQSQSDSQQTNSPSRAKLFNLLSETSGAPITGIEEGATLAELGVDSLSAVELKDDLENAFDVTIDDDEFTLDSTVMEVMKFFNIGSNANTPAPPPDTTTVAARPPNETSRVEAGQTQDATPDLKPMEALLECETTFDDSARRRGFLNYWTDVAPKQDELLLAYISDAFQTLNSDLRDRKRGEVVPMFQYLPKHEKVMQRLLQILEKHSILSKQGPRFIRDSGNLPTRPTQDLHNDFVAQFPPYTGEANLMQLTGSKLADCLTGKNDAVALMFKGSAAQKIMGDYYCDSPMLSTLTEHLVSFFTILVNRNKGHTNAPPIRFFEVGAGFGGTTSRLAEILQASGVPVEYTFTDISPSLVKNAKSKFAKYNWMRFQPFNLENEPPASLKGQFDIIIGTNCVHATTDKTKSVGRLRQLLSNKGFVLLSEVTQLVDWYDIVFGLLEGWWLAKDGSTYPLQPPESWMGSFGTAGFKSFTYSKGPTPESNTQRLLIASQEQVSQPPRPVSSPSSADHVLETVVYKEAEEGVEIPADIYVPTKACGKAMPVALMIHGGGHMTLSRKAIRPAQTAFLLSNNFLPISLDYRLCPEINLIDGAMTDIRDACAWVQSSSRTGLQGVLDGKGIPVRVDRTKFVVIGWSTGGHLAMSTAWTTKAAGLGPPSAILSFYGPTDFETGDLDGRRAEMYPERRLPLEKIIHSLPTRPITSYDSNGSIDTTGLGWVRPGDPRSELVLSLFKEGTGLPLMLHGLPSSTSPDGTPSPLLSQSLSPARVAAISPMAQLRAGKYTTPTFLIHGERDEIVPFHTSTKFSEEMRRRGVKGNLLKVNGKRHIHDLGIKEGEEGWNIGVGPGYDFLVKEVRGN